MRQRIPALRTRVRDCVGSLDATWRFRAVFRDGRVSDVVLQRTVPDVSRRTQTQCIREVLASIELPSGSGRLQVHIASPPPNLEHQTVGELRGPRGERLGPNGPNEFGFDPDQVRQSELANQFSRTLERLHGTHSTHVEVGTIRGARASTVRRVVRRQRRELQECFARRTQEDIDVKIVIRAGNVVESTSEQSTQTAVCVLEATRRWRFPARVSTTVVVPLTFSWRQTPAATMR